MKSTLDKRHISRILVLQRLFERYFRNQDIRIPSDNEFTNQDLVEVLELEEQTKYDKLLFDKLLKGTIGQVEKSDHIISKLAPDWPINQINKVDLQILRMAIFEGFIEKITPEKVVIDEAVELAKSFGGKPSANFVNGVLGNLLNNQNKFEQILNKK